MRRGDRWYIEQASRAARHATDPIERGKHTKILLDIYMKGVDDPKVASRSSTKFLEIAYRGPEITPHVAMARSAMRKIRDTRRPRMIYVGRHIDSDPAFALSVLTNGLNQPSLQAPIRIDEDGAHRAIVMNSKYTEAMLGENTRRLLVDGAVPLLRGRLDYQAAHSEWFTEDPETPTEIIVGRRAIIRWAHQAVDEQPDEIAGEYAQKILDLDLDSIHSGKRDTAAPMNHGIYDS